MEYKEIRELTKQAKLKCSMLTWEYDRTLERIEAAAKEGSDSIEISIRNPHYYNLFYILTVDGYAINESYSNDIAWVSW